MKMKAIDAGSFHSLALDVDGAVWAWGGNGEGQLGDGSKRESANAPVRVKGLEDVKTIVAGQDCSIALKDDGTVWGWGKDDATKIKSNVPVRIDALTGVTQVASGRSHFLALKEDGTALSWGYNGWAALGTGNHKNSRTPCPVKGLTEAISVAGGDGFSLALRRDGTVWGWGSLSPGAAPGKGKSKTAVLVQGVTNVIAIAASYSQAFALQKDGTVWTWQSSAGKLLGSKKKSSPGNTPEQIDGLTDIIAISSKATDNDRIVALKKDGTVWSLGSNVCGELGNGTNKDIAAPAQASGMKGVIAISAGRGHTLALKKDGTVAAWGSNRCEQLGDGTGLDRNLPVLVKSPGTAVIERDEAFESQLKVLNNQLRNHGTGSWQDKIDIPSLSDSQLEFLKELLRTRLEEYVEIARERYKTFYEADAKKSRAKFAIQVHKLKLPDFTKKKPKWELVLGGRSFFDGTPVIVLDLDGWKAKSVVLVD